MKRYMLKEYIERFVEESEIGIVKCLMSFVSTTCYAFLCCAEPVWRNGRTVHSGPRVSQVLNSLEPIDFPLGKEINRHY